MDERTAEDLFVAFLASDRDDFESLLAENPDRAVELRQLQRDWERVGGVLERVGVARSLESRLEARYGLGESTVILEPEAPPSSGLSGFLKGLGERRQSFGRYRLKDIAGRGGMGVVLRVWDNDLKRHLAMKVCRSDGDEGHADAAANSRSMGRFLEEAQVTGQLDHPGIVPVHELGLDDRGGVYFTMKLVRGHDLGHVYQQVLEGRDGWTRTRTVGVLSKVCEAMAYAHHKGVIHRDLKPANVMVGDFGAVYVMDWGLARVMGTPDAKDSGSPLLEPSDPVRSDRRDFGSASPDSPILTEEGEVMGTPAYMSPEQAMGRLSEVGPQSDVYSMGAMLYHLLAGAMPYAESGDAVDNFAIWALAREGAPQPLADVAPDAPPELVAICERAMARSLSERYETMWSLAEDLRAYLEGRVVQAYESGAWAEARKWVRRNKGLAASLAAAAVLLVSGLSAVGLVQAAGKRAEEKQRKIAQANFELAELRRADAAAAEARAVASELEAKAQEQEATARADDVLRLSALQDLDELTALADELWPPYPERVPAYESWLERARVLIEELPQHERRRQDVLSRALPRSSEERARDRREHPLAAELEGARSDLDSSLVELDNALALADSTKQERAEAQVVDAEARVVALEKEVSRPWRWQFATSEDRWWHAQLTRLIEGIEDLADPEAGLVSGTTQEHGWGIERRLEFALTVEELTVTGVEAAARWERALGSIGNAEECPAYGGLNLSPQMGLLPVGRDPNSGLWEFWHVLSGAEPQRGDDGEFVLSEDTGLVLVLLPGGSFWMGSQGAEPEGRNYDPGSQSSEQPVHAVELTAFFLSKYELTQGQWKRSTHRNPSYYGPDGLWSRGYWSRLEYEASLLHPVEQVDWHTAREFLERMDLTLPTEAQWEYGARGGTSSVWWRGDEPGDLVLAGNVSDEYRNRGGGTSEWGFEPWDDGNTVHASVGSFQANGFGLYDVVGNVMEWCFDGFDREFYVTSVVRDPSSAPEGAASCVTRGGSFSLTSASARSAFRFHTTSDSASTNLGVRAARAISR